MAFPCNQFLYQEPGSREAIKSFVGRYNARFPVFDKISVRGPDTHPVYRFLRHHLPGIAVPPSALVALGALTCSLVVGLAPETWRVGAGLACLAVCVASGVLLRCLQNAVPWNFGVKFFCDRQGLPLKRFGAGDNWDAIDAYIRSTLKGD